MIVPGKYDAIIIGAGLAGIACAIRLRSRGKKVLVIEKNLTHGGKLSEISWGDYRWDKGPSLFTEPNLIEDLFECAGKDISDYFEYEKRDESCRYFFPDFTKATLFSDETKLDPELNGIAGKKDKLGYYKYLESSKKMYDSVGNFFISNPIPGISEVLKSELLSKYHLLLKKELRQSLNTVNKTSFKNEKLINIFNRFGTYNGSNPYKMSGLYSMVSHLELLDGTFAPKKGMRSIVDSLYKLSTDIGVDYEFNENVKAKLDINEYTLSGKRIYTCDNLICAIDHLTFYKEVFVENSLHLKYKKQERSTSGMVFYWAVNHTFPELGLHNIFFSEDYEKESEVIWKQKSLPKDPTLYINISSKVNGQDSPQKGENWFVMVNTPAGVKSTDEYRSTIRKLIINKIHHHFKVDITDKIEHEEYWDCKGIEDATGSYKGAIYGPNSNNLTSAIKRHKNKSKKYKNMYFCGGTVHPGGGIPLVLRSAKIVDDYV